MDRRLTWYILGGMILGVIVGYAVYKGVPADHDWFGYLTKTFKLLSDIFLHLIKLLVAPLILSTIVVGIAHMGDSSALGRIGFRAIAWFITASFISIGLGLLDGQSWSSRALERPSFQQQRPRKKWVKYRSTISGRFMLSIFPKNAFEALATNNILQILGFLDLCWCRTIGHRRKRCAASPRCRRAGGNDAADHRLCHALCSDRGFRRNCRSGVGQAGSKYLAPM